MRKSQSPWTTSRKAMIWAVWLISVYVAAQVFADITATKMISLVGIVVPGGTLIYALTFTLSDFIQRKLGKKTADLLVVVSGIINVGMALYFQLIIGMPYPPFWGAQEAFASTLGIVWMIVGPSILAEVVSGLLDNVLYDLVKQRPALGMLLSNLVSVPTDSIVFGSLAFGVLPLLFPSTGAQPMTIAALWSMIKGQVIFKWVVGAVIMPIMYFVRQGDQ